MKKELIEPILFLLLLTRSLLWTSQRTHLWVKTCEREEEKEVMKQSIVLQYCEDADCSIGFSFIDMYSTTLFFLHRLLN